MSDTAAVNKMIDYMDQAGNHGSRDPNLRGYLVRGNEIIPFWLDDNGVTNYGATFDMFAPGDQFTTELCNIAVANWN